MRQSGLKGWVEAAAAAAAYECQPKNRFDVSIWKKIKNKDRPVCVSARAVAATVPRPTNQLSVIENRVGTRRRKPYNIIYRGYHKPACYIHYIPICYIIHYYNTYKPTRLYTPGPPVISHATRTPRIITHTHTHTRDVY